MAWVWRLGKGRIWGDPEVRMRARVRRLLTWMSWAAAMFAATEAAACGGSFGVAEPTRPGAVAAPVTGHRMVFAVSDERTVLWDQIQYAGAPEDFSWVLPVVPGAYLEASRNAWFEALDAVTTKRVSPPILQCDSSSDSSSSFGCGCGATGLAGDDDSAAGATNDHGITVLSQGTVGPYQTVTLSSTDGDTLTNWLQTSGYAVPDDVAPIIGDYVSEGFDFIALRLKPGADVGEMTPVRVVTPGPRGPLPFRMVAAGVGKSVAVTLYLVGEARYALPDLHESSLDERNLTWDFQNSSNNYASLEAQALGENAGASYLTSFAEPGAFYGTQEDADGNALRFNVGPTSFQSFSTLYYALSGLGDSGTLTRCPAIDDYLRSPTLVTETGDAGLAASVFTCDDYDDIGAALVGMHPASVWLTRVDMNLPRAALSADCVVEPNASQAVVSNAIRAERAKNPPADCPVPLFETSVVSRSARGTVVWMTLLGLGALARLRRRRAP